jgi:hypothetical protein
MSIKFPAPNRIAAVNDSGLPDYVDDLFRYLVRSSVAIRIAQVVFFISGLILPVLMLMILPNADGERALDTHVPLFVIGSIFAACLLSYLGWLEMRQRKVGKSGSHSLVQASQRKSAGTMLMSSRAPSQMVSLAMMSK